MTREDFDKALQNVYELHPEWRYGQAAFNVLCVMRPELAERIRGTDSDPFYRAPGDLNSFVDFLDMYWPHSVD